MASAVITREAYTLAADPAKFPEQIKEGLRPWQPKKLYHLAAFGFPGEPPVTGRVTRVNAGVYDTLLGKTYNEIGTEARSMHKCQGMGQLLSLPAPTTAFAASYQLVETTIPAQLQKDEASLFDGVDSSLLSLARFAGARAPKDLVDGLTTIANATQAAQKAFDTAADEATMKPLVDGLFAVRVLRRELRSMAGVDEAGRFEIDFRLRQKEGEFQQAIVLAHGVKVEALADDGVVVPGQPVKVNVIVANRGAGDVVIKSVKFDGFDPSTGSGPVCTMTAFDGGGFFFPGAGGRGRGNAPAPVPMPSVRKDQVAHCEPTLTVPANARVSEPYWHRKGEAGRYTFDADAPFGLPMRPSPFYVQVTLALPGGEEVIQGLPVQHRYEGDIFSGEKRSELLVVPAFSVRVTPQVAIVPESSIRSTPVRTAARPEGRALQPSTVDKPSAVGRGRPSGRPASSIRPASSVASGAPSSEREIRVTVLNDTTGAAETSVKLELPQGWSATPNEQPVKFSRSDESQTVRFMLKPSSSVGAGEYHVKAVVSSGGQTYNRGFQVIEYPHIKRYHIYDEADATLKVINVRTPSDLLIGYVMGVGDQVPPAIEQLGAKVQLLTAEDLAWGDLSKFTAIVTGVRAYERRDDLRANNSRLLDYVFKGGTMIVQYNKFEFNDAQYGPYPAKVSSNRVTDENAAVQAVAAHSTLLTTPNEIGDAAWKNWVQERGTYFLAEDKDSRYHDVVQMEDNFPYNKGMKTGALVEATYGKGRWVYVGLGLWRQLPVGTDGAYQILANLISAGKK